MAETAGLDVVVDVPVDSAGYRLINELTAENERLRQHLSASDGAEREWHNLATKGVTASAKWKTELAPREIVFDTSLRGGVVFNTSAGESRRTR